MVYDHVYNLGICLMESSIDTPDPTLHLQVNYYFWEIKVVHKVCHNKRHHKMQVSQINLQVTLLPQNILKF